MSTQSKLDIIIRTLAEMRGAQQATETLRKTEQEAQRLEQRWNKVSSAAMTAGGALLAVSAAGGAAIGNTTMLAARVETLGVVTAQLGENVGMTEGEVRSLEQAIVQKGITLQASRQAIAQMIQAEIDLSHATDLARAAQDTAVIANENSSESFQRLVTVIASGNVVMARRMGLMVNFQAAYEREAKALGKSALELTAYEKVQIRTNEVLRAAANITGTYEAAMTTAGKKQSSLARHWEESRRILGERYLPAFADLIDLATEGLIVFRNLDDETNDQVATWLTYTTAVTGASGGILLAIGSFLKLKMALGGIAAALGIATSGLLAVTAAAGAWIVAGGMIVKTAVDIKKGIEAVSNAYDEHNHHMVEVADNYDAYVKEMVRAAVASKKITEYQGEQIIAFSQSERSIQELTDSTGIYDKVLLRLLDDIELATEAEFNHSRSMKRSADNADELQDKYRQLAVQEEYATAKGDEFAAANKRVALSLGEVTKASIAREALSAINQLYEDGKISAEKYREALNILGLEMLGISTSMMGASIKAQQLRQDFLSGKLTLDEYMAAVRGLGGALDGLPSHIPIDIWINVHGNIPNYGGMGYWVGAESTDAVVNTSTGKGIEHRGGGDSYTGNRPAGGIKAYQGVFEGHSGLDFIVPPGYPNDSFGPIFVESGEHVKVTPAGIPPSAPNEMGGPTIVNVFLDGALVKRTITRGVRRQGFVKMS